jgi:hypothetical protein
MKRITRASAAGILAAGFLATACGHPLIPASALKPPAKSAASAHATPTATPLAPYKVKRPILGVDLYAQNNYLPAATFVLGVRTISYIKNVLGAKAIGILWNFYSPGRTSDVVQARKSTMSVADVMMLTRLARRYGLAVEWRPLIFVPSHANNPWEGLINPPDPQAWFSSYFHAEYPYLKAAQKLHVSEFVAQTELHVLNPSPLWGSFFKRVGKVYHGVVSYASWYGDYLPPKGHLLPVRLYGMDMYKALNLTYKATTAQVTAAWEKAFAGVPESVLKRTALDEEGIEARRGAYKLPPNLGAPGVPDEAVQANWFTAACRTVAHYHMRAVYFFKVDLTDNPAEPASSLSTFEGRKGAVAISDCAKLFQ